MTEPTPDQAAQFAEERGDRLPGALPVLHNGTSFYYDFGVRDGCAGNERYTYSDPGKSLAYGAGYRDGQIAHQAEVTPKPYQLWVEHEEDGRPVRLSLTATAHTAYCELMSAVAGSACSTAGFEHLDDPADPLDIQHSFCGACLAHAIATGKFRIVPPPGYGPVVPFTAPSAGIA